MKKLSAIALLAALTVAPVPAMAEELMFKLTNQSSYTITNFYTSPTTTDDWEEDVFGEGVFLPGYTVPIRIVDGSDQCVYDMKFVPEGADEFIVEGIDVCALAGNEYVLSDAE
ncbi:MAG: hypothetical protein ABIO40_02050 [Devosia sp.]